jgi:hypothetical protein
MGRNPALQFFGLWWVSRRARVFAGRLLYWLGLIVAHGENIAADDETKTSRRTLKQLSPARECRDRPLKVRRKLMIAIHCGVSLTR